MVVFTCCFSLTSWYRQVIPHRTWGSLPDLNRVEHKQYNRFVKSWAVYHHHQREYRNSVHPSSGASHTQSEIHYWTWPYCTAVRYSDSQSLLVGFEHFCWSAAVRHALLKLGELWVSLTLIALGLPHLSWNLMLFFPRCSLDFQWSYPVLWTNAGYIQPLNMIIWQWRRQGRSLSPDTDPFIRPFFH